jgi:tetratricopeptide (TPR) repeat protein
MTGKIFVPLLILVGTTFASGQSEALLGEARRELGEGNFIRAVELLDSLEGLGVISPSLYLAQGNAYFQTGRIGRAVLAYERGLRLRPGDRDLENNLRYVREEAGILTRTLPEFFLLRWWRAVAGWLGVRLAVYMGLFFLWLAVAGATRWYLYRNTMAEKRRFALLPLSGLCLVLALLIFALAQSRYHHLNRTDEAILLAPSAQLRVSPTGNSSVEAELTEGVHLSITDHLENYVKVRLPDGRQGYLRTTEVRVI